MAKVFFSEKSYTVSCKFLKVHCSRWCVYTIAGLWPAFSRQFSKLHFEVRDMKQRHFMYFWEITLSVMKVNIFFGLNYWRWKKVAESCNCDHQIKGVYSDPRRNRTLHWVDIPPVYANKVWQEIWFGNAILNYHTFNDDSEKGSKDEKFTQEIIPLLVYFTLTLSLRRQILLA